MVLFYWIVKLKSINFYRVYSNSAGVTCAKQMG
jgi:hypothetical protein